jgi:hypothetical protein
MQRLSFFCLVVLSSLIFCSSKSLELDSPLPKEGGSWKHVPGQITLFLGEDADEEALRFVTEEQEETSPIVLSLDKPANKEDVDAFLQKCFHLLEHKGIGTGAFVATGKSITGHLQQWLSKNGSMNEEESAPNLTGVVFGTPALKVIAEPENKQPAVQVKYRFQLPKVQTTRDLRKMWSIALIQRMTAQRFQIQKVSAEIPETGSFLLPGKAIAYKVNSEGLKRFLKNMQEIKQVGFTIEELTEAKQYFLAKVREMQKDTSSKPTHLIASFHAEGFLRNLGLVSYAYYLESASSLIDSITPVDIAIALNECYDEDKRLVTLYAPSSQTENFEMFVRKEIDESEKLSIDRSPAPVATELDPSLANAQLFYQLPISDGDKELIYKIIDTMAKDNVIKLGLKRKSMERKGKKIRHVHPLRFLGHIFADRHLKHCMREISRSSFKWNGFIDGLKDRIKEEAARNNLMQYVHGFAQQVNGDEQKIARYLENRDWEGLVRCLL